MNSSDPRDEGTLIDGTLIEGTFIDGTLIDGGFIDGGFIRTEARAPAVAVPAIGAGAQPPHAWPLAGRVRSLGETRDDVFSVLAFLRAGLACGAVHPDRTLWVIDLAPSDGERAWRVLHTLHEEAPRGPPIRYLACCRNHAHRNALAAHPPLRALLDEGRLRLDVDDDWLRVSAPRNPLVVLAYEAFSSAPQGLYRVGGGVLEEATGEGAAPWRPLARGDGPSRLLSAYADAPQAVPASLPLGAMRTLETLLRLGEGRMLLRAVDRGIEDAQAIRDGALLRTMRAAEAAQGRAVRLPVNFDALARWHRAQGGGLVHTQRGERGRLLHLAVHDRDNGRLQACLQDLAERPHPDDHAVLLDALGALHGLAPSQCQSLLHAAHADPRALDALRRAAPASIEALERGSKRGIRARWGALCARCALMRYPAPSDPGPGLDGPRAESPASRTSSRSSRSSRPGLLESDDGASPAREDTRWA